MLDEKDAQTLMVARLDALIDLAGGRSASAKIMDITPKTLTDWKNHPDKIRMTSAARLAEYVGHDLGWLMHGSTEQGTDPNRLVREQPKRADDRELIFIPLFDAQLSAGDGQLLDRVDILDQIPFSVDILQYLGVQNTDDLGFFTVTGDSMDPTAPDGSRAMVDMRDQHLVEGIFAIEIEGDARIKRLRKRITGEIEVISDNEHYDDEVLSGEDLNLLKIIGRVRWLAKWL